MPSHRVEFIVSILNGAALSIKPIRRKIEKKKKDILNQRKSPLGRAFCPSIGLFISPVAVEEIHETAVCETAFLAPESSDDRANSK